MSLSPGDEIGGYRILSHLGSGGMGTVYRAEQLQLQREVALKVLTSIGEPDPETVKRFHREMELMVQLSHPHLVTVYDAGTEAGQDYLAMELVEGGTLEEQVRGGQALDPGTGLRITLELARAVAYLHERGVFHRDIKPINVLLTPEGRPKLADFGLARGEHHTMMTRASQVLGTPRYIAPEILQGEGAGAPADVFSLGVLAYRVISGRFPFPAGSYGEYLKALATQEPVPLGELVPGLPDAAAPLIMRMLSKVPFARPFALDVVHLLEGIEAGEARVKLGRAGEPVDPLAATARRSGRLRATESQPGARRTVTKVSAVATAGRRGPVGALVIFVTAAFGVWSWLGARQPVVVEDPGLPGPTAVASAVAPAGVSDTEREAGRHAQDLRHKALAQLHAMRARMKPRNELEDTLVLPAREVAKAYSEMALVTHRARQLLRDFAELPPDGDVWLDVFEAMDALLAGYSSLEGSVRDLVVARKQHAQALETLLTSLRAADLPEASIRHLAIGLLIETLEISKADVTPASAGGAPWRPDSTNAQRRLALLLDLRMRHETIRETMRGDADRARWLTQRARLQVNILNARWGGGTYLYRLGQKREVDRNFVDESKEVLDMVRPFVSGARPWPGDPDRTFDLFDSAARTGVVCARMDWSAGIGDGRAPAASFVLQVVEDMQQIIRRSADAPHLTPRQRELTIELATMGRDRLQKELEVLKGG